MDTKECTKCKDVKELTDFGKDTRNTDGLKSVCKVCLSNYKKEYKLLNKANIAENEKKYKEANKDKIKEYEKNRYKKNKNEISKKHKEYKLKYKERDRAKNNKTSNEYKKKRCAIDPLYKLKINIRCLISITIKRSGYKKPCKTINILGCSGEYFKQHIESKFLPWMNWDNYGKYNGSEGFGWDLDHIEPISNANTYEDVIRLNHYTNLQPLCSKVNRDVKKNKINLVV